MNLRTWRTDILVFFSYRVMGLLLEAEVGGVSAHRARQLLYGEACLPRQWKERRAESGLCLEGVLFRRSCCSGVDSLGVVYV